MANVLIVDDDSDTVELSTELLESSGHRVQTGYNGDEGLKSLAGGKLPDCVVLDVDGSGKSGRSDSGKSGRSKKEPET